MIHIELVPDTTHCIETVARIEYRNLVKACLCNEEDNLSSASKQELELLRLFLESADFKKLRRESEQYLIQGRKVKFIVYSEQGNVMYRMVVDKQDSHF